MSNISSNDLIDDVAPGDIVAVDRDNETLAAKVVHKETVDDGFLITFEAPDAQTFEVRYPAGTRITRSLESKWESGQSPTPHKPV
ncbi:hypothetical protein SAMN04489835_1471 [Mycolicibacterium rutilum]|uniref:Uncharacterized protein n=1 Tax=Mycolicibacterium rutilum TaxID=370526 RepID=A0A1H6J7N9_MYCRU|nr:hypothetical protein [Mycolicibacterium rutilum]SEH56342.1 hypothetical protein SAMN04489835_1471 [Mycolicibacterium rutilum]